MVNGCTNAKIIEPTSDEIIPCINHEQLIEKINSLEQNARKII